MLIPETLGMRRATTSEHTFHAGPPWSSACDYVINSHRPTVVVLRPCLALQLGVHPLAAANDLDLPLPRENEPSFPGQNIPPCSPGVTNESLA